LVRRDQVAARREAGDFSPALLVSSRTPLLRR
jgi:hypothetical protein